MKNARTLAGALAALTIAAIATLPAAGRNAAARGGSGIPPVHACAHDLTGCRR